MALIVTTPETEETTALRERRRPNYTVGWLFRWLFGSGITP